MSVQEVKNAVDAGKIVHWSNLAYTVIKGKMGYLIKCEVNNSCVGLTDAYEGERFFIEE